MCTDTAPASAGRPAHFCHKDSGPEHNLLVVLAIDDRADVWCRIKLGFLEGIDNAVSGEAVIGMVACDEDGDNRVGTLGLHKGNGGFGAFYKKKGVDENILAGADDQAGYGGETCV